MKNLILKKNTLFIFLLVFTVSFSQNPFVTDIYTADPTARVFNGKLYVYPSHDVDVCNAGQGNNGFCMPDYHVFSTDDLYNWTDHGVIVTQNEVPWVKRNSYGMWAPDCVERNGTYYFYFPAPPANQNVFRRIGVATASSPTGPFTPLNTHIQGIQGIDPNVFIDDDNQAYLYFGSGNSTTALKVIKLKNNMIETKGNQIPLTLPRGYKEGAFMFKKSGLYYLTFARVTPKNYEIEYATSNSPTGPFQYKGVIMPNIDKGTNHHSIVQYKGKWYIFYHYWSLSNNKKLRSIRADEITFNTDGTINPKTATIRGIGIPKSGDIIHIDRYNKISNAQVHKVQGNEPNGFQVDFIKNNGWVRFNEVDFTGQLTELKARVSSGSQGGTLEFRANSVTGPLLGTMNISNTGGWEQYQTITTDKVTNIDGIKDLFCVFKGTGTYLFNVNWVSFTTDSSPNPTEEPPIGQIISLRKTGGDLKYVTAEKFNNNNQLIARSNVTLGWEKFLVETHPNGGVTLKALSNNKYIQVFDKNTNIPIRATAINKSNWTQFTWKSKGLGEVALYSVHANTWIQASHDVNNAVLYPKGNLDQEWETFNWKIESASKAIDEKEIIFFPNPLNNKSLNINIPKHERSIVTIYLKDLNGKVVYRKEYKNIKETLEIKKLPLSTSQFYFLEIKTPLRSVTHKLYK